MLQAATSPHPVRKWTLFLVFGCTDSESLRVLQEITFITEFSKTNLTNSPHTYADWASNHGFKDFHLVYLRATFRDPFPFFTYAIQNWYLDELVK
ncbi:hypothetical protein QR680_018764 [Steinernema hermaphroditum]|uniref:Uncharacterized protein n=1 Tax=Steinernema hermaphroditum TaxID=289476 RepID=A0AA39LR87_9BILA|nr:hypothetical protein QR680_018764 [Steinernema hermaphroditum]